MLDSCLSEAEVESIRTEETVLDLSPDLSVETEGVADEDWTVAEVTERVCVVVEEEEEEEVESCLSVLETGADEEKATEDETEELTEPQVPARGLQPVPQ